MSKAIVLLSGGMDSATTLAIARSRGFEVSALTFRYGQRHSAELAAATRIAKMNGVSDHLIVEIDPRMVANSALTDEIAVPKNRDFDDMDREIPVTYVPARNTIFLSFALARAEVLSAFDVFIGVNALDYSGYPDCRPEYIAAFEKMANLATKAAIESTSKYRIHTPVVDMTKAQIIQAGLELGVDFGITSTCYDPAANGDACGSCDACLLRLQAFKENELQDPVSYSDRERIAT